MSMFKLSLVRLAIACRLFTILRRTVAIISGAAAVFGRPRPGRRGSPGLAGSSRVFIPDFARQLLCDAVVLLGNAVPGIGDPIAFPPDLVAAVCLGVALPRYVGSDYGGVSAVQGALVARRAGSLIFLPFGRGRIGVRRQILVGGLLISIRSALVGLSGLLVSVGRHLIHVGGRLIRVG